MSDQFLDEFCAKLEAALTENESQSTTTDQEIGSHLSRLTRRMELLAETVKKRKQAENTLRETVLNEISGFRAALADELSSGTGKQERIDQLERDLAAQADAVQAGHRHVDELVQTVEERDAELTELRNQVGHLNSQLAGARSEFESVSAERDRATDSEAALSDATAELEQAREELDQLRASAEKVGAAERLLEAERERANDLEQRLRAETANGTKAIIAQQLADALRDGEAAREEAASLRVELQNLRREIEEKAAETERITTPKRPKVGRDVQKRQLGEMLMEAGVISQEQLDSALAAQAESPNRSLAEILVHQGAVEEEVVTQAAAAQHRVLYVNLNDNSIDPAAAALISFKIAQQHQCVPVRATEDSLVLAMADPLNVIAIEDVERASSRSVRPVMATQSAIAAAIDRAYQTQDEQIP